MWLLLWNQLKGDINHPVNSVIKSIKLFTITSFCIFAPLYAYIEQAGMGTGTYLSALGNTLYFIEVVSLTIGFGDYSPKMPLGKLVFCIYGVHGVYMGAAILSGMVSVRMHILDSISRGKYIMTKFERHIIIFARSSEFSDKFADLARLLDEFQRHPFFVNNPILLINTSPVSSHPEFAAQLAQYGGSVEIAHYHADITSEHPFTPEFYNITSFDECKACLILCQDNESSTLHLASTITSRPSFDQSKLHVEAKFSSCRRTIKEMGAGGVYIPNRHYPEFIVCAMCTPGADDFLTEIVSSTDNTIFSFKLPHSANNLAWVDLIRKIMASTTFEGIPIGYTKKDKTTTINPPPSQTIVDMDAILCIVNSSRVNYDTLQDQLSSIN